MQKKQKTVEKLGSICYTNLNTFLLWRTTMKRIITILVAITVFAVLVSGCAKKSANAVDQIKENGKIIVYCNANFPPYEYIQGADVVGVDIEIGKAIAEKLGVELEIKNTAFDGIVAAIASGKGDISISGMTITEDRKKEVDFSKPYINSVQYLIVKNESTLEKVEDLAGKKVAAVLGYTGSLILDDEIGKNEGVLKGKDTVLNNYNSAGDATLALTTGKVDVVIMDEMVAKSIVAKDSTLKAVKLTYADGSDTAEEYGVAIKKGKDDLLAIVNEVIDDLLANNKIEEFMNMHVVQ